MRKLFLLLALCLPLAAIAVDKTSVAGFYQMQGSGRIVYNFDQGWRFYLGDAKGADAKDYDDSQWTVVNVPHSVRLEPSEASGGRNYQGIAWYRKHFTMPADMAGKNVTLHFEAIMGKQAIYVNGQLVKEHLGGYLPITIDLTKAGIKPGDSCVIAVKADNSDDKTYPPGKKQSALDFCYHGGMYRDVWLIGKSPIAITDAIEAGKVGGGGVFLHYDNIEGNKAHAFINVDVANNSTQQAEPTVIARIKNKEGKTIVTLKKKITIAAGQCTTAYLGAILKNIQLWSPETPYLYNVDYDGQQKRRWRHGAHGHTQS